MGGMFYKDSAIGVQMPLASELVFMSLCFCSLCCLHVCVLYLGTEQSLFQNMAGQNVTGQVLLLSLSEVVQHLFEANINGAVK